MSASLAAYGLRPIRHLSGRVYAQAFPDGLASGYATDLYKGTPVMLDTNGHIVIATNGSDFLGAFAGVEYDDTNGVRQYANRWTANTTATNIVVYVYADPDIVYSVQADGSLAQSAVGDQADFSVAAGSTLTDGDNTVQVSKTAIGALKGAGVQGMVRVLDATLDPANAWGDAFTEVEVQVARHQFVAAKVAI